MKKRVAILISGGGSNMLALLRDMATGDHPAEPVLVASNDPTATGLVKAAAEGVPTAAVDHRPFGKDRAAFEAALLALVSRESKAFGRFVNQREKRQPNCRDT